MLEIKTIGLTGFEALKAPSLIHLMQGHIYAYRFDVPIMWFWYYCKNNSKRKCFAVLFDDAIWDKTLERVYMLANHVNNNTLPDREESWYMCPRCEYEHICKPSVTKKKRRSEERRVGKEGRSGWAP